MRRAILTTLAFRATLLVILLGSVSSGENVMPLYAKEATSSGGGALRSARTQRSTLVEINEHNFDDGSEGRKKTHAFAEKYRRRLDNVASEQRGHVDDHLMERHLRNTKFTRGSDDRNDKSQRDGSNGEDRLCNTKKERKCRNSCFEDDCMKDDEVCKKKCRNACCKYGGKSKGRERSMGDDEDSGKHGSGGKGKGGKPKPKPKGKGKGGKPKTKPKGKGEKPKTKPRPKPKPKPKPNKKPKGKGNERDSDDKDDKSQKDGVNRLCNTETERKCRNSCFEDKCMKNDEVCEKKCRKSCCKYEKDDGDDEDTAMTKERTKFSISTKETKLSISRDISEDSEDSPGDSVRAREGGKTGDSYDGNDAVIMNYSDNGGGALRSANEANNAGIIAGAAVGATALAALAFLALAKKSKASGGGPEMIDDENDKLADQSVDTASADGSSTPGSPPSSPPRTPPSSPPRGGNTPSPGSLGIGGDTPPPGSFGIGGDIPPPGSPGIGGDTPPPGSSVIGEDTPPPGLSGIGQLETITEDT